MYYLVFLFIEFSTTSIKILPLMKDLNFYVQQHHIFNVIFLTITEITIV